MRSFQKVGRIGAVLLGCLVAAFFPETLPGAQNLFPIYQQWAGTGSSYPGMPAYQVIRRLEELQDFWERHAVGDPMPHLNFDTCMLFVWAPGPSRFDYRPQEVAEFGRDAQGLYLILKLERKDTGGFWRGPFLMAILPKQPGHIRVARPGRVLQREPAFMPLAMIYDMGGALAPITETVVGKGGSGASGTGTGAAVGTGVGSASETGTGTGTEAGAVAGTDVGTSVSAPGATPGAETKIGAEPATKPAEAEKPAEPAKTSGETASDPFNIDF